MRINLIFISLLALTSCHNTERNCKDYKTGSYYSEVIIDSILYKSEFTRNADIQVEFYDKKTDSSEVRWINDCEMVFRTINPKNRAQRKDVHLKILTTTDTSYRFEYSYVGEKLKQKGIAFKK